MKKILLSALVLGASALSFGQDLVTIYGPGETFANGAYSFDGITYTGDTVAGVKSALVASGSTEGYYIGGMGFAQFTGETTPPTALGTAFDGLVANSSIKLNITTFSPEASVKAQFKTGDKTFGYIQALANPGGEYSFDASELKELGGPNSDPIGEVITDAEFAAITEFQLTMNCGAMMGVCTIELELNSFEIAAVVASINGNTANSSIQLFPNPASSALNFSTELSNVVIANSLGSVVETINSAQSVDVSNYQSGVYFLQADGFSSTFIVE